MPIIGFGQLGFSCLQHIVFVLCPTKQYSPYCAQLEPRVRLCPAFSGQNEAFVTRLVKNTVASLLIFVESQKNGDRNPRS